MSLAAEEREKFLAGLVPADQELREELRGLLAAEADAAAAEASLERKVAAAAALPDRPAFAKPPSSIGPESRVGPYRILRELGRGGLGTVYLAERDDQQFTRRVALKVVRQGMESEVVLQRLRRERQILAELDHPNIARLYDGGATAEGLPYFAMELIDGERIDVWCAARKAPLRQRLELMQRICEAVHYAHKSLVLHRDLKTSNILVNAAGEPKLLDFGIAKVLEAGDEQASSTSISAEAFTLTETGHLLLTPEFASPEQVRGENLTTASDVYSLGVVLYLLVTGQRPYQFDRRRMAEIERVICSTEPPRPSELARRFPAMAAPGWQPPPAGDDLDNILAMALRKEPERRYSTAAELSEDLRRYREDLPVLARADTAGYRLRKFARRHRFGVSAATAFVLLLLATAALTTWQANRAEKERARAEGVANFLLEVFRVSDPYESLGNKVTAREILDRSTARMKSDPSLSPDLRASLLETMGKVYQNLSLFAPAGELLEEARALRQAGGDGASAAEYRKNLAELARLDIRRHRFREAAAWVEEAERAPAGLLPDRELQVELARLHGEALAGLDRYEEAEKRLLQALEAARSVSIAERAEVIESLGDLWLGRQDPGRAGDYYAQALALRLQRFGEQHPLVANNRSDLALALQGQGKLVEAEQQFRQLLATYRTMFGERHANFAVALYNLAANRLNQRDPDQAEGYFQQALALRRELYGETHPAVAEVWIGLARCAQMRASLAGKAGLADQRSAYLGKAAELAQRALSIDQASLGEQNLQTLRDLFLLAELSLAQGDPAAESHFLAIVAMLRSKAPGDPRLATALVAVGKSRLAQGQAVSAEAPLREALTLLAADSLARAEAEAQLAFSLEAQKRAAEALQLVGSALKVYEARSPASPITERLRSAKARLAVPPPS